MINLRNIQVFGWRAYRPEKRHMIPAVIVLLVIVIGTFWVLRSNEQNASTIASGAAVAPVPLEESQEQASTTIQSTNESLPEEPLAQEEEQKEFYEFGGKCSSDVKDAQDDVTDVNTYLSQFQQEQSTLQAEQTSLQAEYEAKLAELKQFYESRLKDYEMKIQSRNKQVSDGQLDLERAQKNLQETQARCEPTP